MSRHSFEKERRQSENLVCVLQRSIVKRSIVKRSIVKTSIVKRSICGQDRDPLLKDRYDIQDRKWFLLTSLFSLRIFQDTKTQKCCFPNKMTCLSKHSFKTPVHSH